MNEITNGDIDGAHAYSNGSSGSRKVIESLAPSVKALGIADEDNAEKSGTWYCLYSLTVSTNGMARTTLRQENGKRIAVIPAASVDDEPSLAQVASGSCLAAMDFDEWCKNGTDIGETVTSYGFDFSDPAKAYSTREVRVWLAYFYSAKNHKVIRGGYCGSSKKWLRANTIALDSMAL